MTMADGDSGEFKEGAYEEAPMGFSLPPSTAKPLPVVMYLNTPVYPG